LSWRRGDKSVEVELSRVQSQIETWSDELDGENGVIRITRDDRAERRGAINSLKVIAWFLGIIASLEAVLEGLRIFKVIH
jgi:tRNA threonylcarbamoyladenosine modification (KEOPS) complex  Pcc1 subunit